HLAGRPRVFQAIAGNARPERAAVDSGSRWEPIAGYARAVRAGTRILVSGTTATHGESTVVCPGDAEGQTVYILDKIGAAIEALGGELGDVARTRIYVRDAACAERVARVHGRYFGAIRPAYEDVAADRRDPSRDGARHHRARAARGRRHAPRRGARAGLRSGSSRRGSGVRGDQETTRGLARRQYDRLRAAGRRERQGRDRGDGAQASGS